MLWITNFRYVVYLPFYLLFFNLFTLSFLCCTDYLPSILLVISSLGFILFAEMKNWCRRILIFWICNIENFICLTSKNFFHSPNSIPTFQLHVLSAFNFSLYLFVFSISLILFFSLILIRSEKIQFKITNAFDRVLNPHLMNGVDCLPEAIVIDFTHVRLMDQTGTYILLKK